MSSGDIAYLIGLVALGDRSAFAQLYRVTSPKLFSICLRILKDRAEAEEALQEVYVKIWQRSKAYSPQSGAPAAWLAAIARNQSIDILRARKPVADELDQAFELADTGPDPERQAVVADDGRQIENCMRELDRERADAVKKAYVEGLSYQELAEEFGVPLNTMRTWLRRSLLKLRECLER